MIYRGTKISSTVSGLFYLYHYGTPHYFTKLTDAQEFIDWLAMGQRKEVAC